MFRLGLGIKHNQGLWYVAIGPNNMKQHKLKDLKV